MRTLRPSTLTRPSAISCSAAGSSAVLDRVDLGLERLDGVVLVDSNHLLGDDRTLVEDLVGEVHRDAGDLHAVVERVLDAVRPGKLGSSAGCRFTTRIG